MFYAVLPPFEVQKAEKKLRKAENNRKCTIKKQKKSRKDVSYINLLYSLDSK
jgi:hypothetical protein